MKDKTLCDVDITKSIAALPMLLKLPLFALDTRAERRDYIEYRELKIDVQAGDAGRATIKDHEIIIYIVSSLVKKFKANLPISNVVDVSVHDFLKTTNRKGSGSNYKQFRQSLERLKTTVFTVIQNDNTNPFPEQFSLISDYCFESASLGYTVQIVIPAWILSKILINKIIYLAKPYFNISNPTQRRIYEICKVKCGDRDAQVISLQNMQILTGLKCPMHKFRALFKGKTFLSAPDYRLRIDSKNCYIYKDTPKGKEKLASVLINRAPAAKTVPTQIQLKNIVLLRSKSSKF
jgi:hypothetical protein